MPLNVILRLVTEVGPSNFSVGREDLDGDVGISEAGVGLGEFSGAGDEGLLEMDKKYGSWLGELEGHTERKIEGRTNGLVEGLGAADETGTDRLKLG